MTTVAPLGDVPPSPALGAVAVTVLAALAQSRAVEDGVIVHIEGNPDSLTKGTMCSKGLSSIQHVDNPYRLKYPLKRAGEKGEGKWKRITWDEAYDTIEKKKTSADTLFSSIRACLLERLGSDIDIVLTQVDGFDSKAPYVINKIWKENWEVREYLI